MNIIQDFPFAQEFITDQTGQVKKVILDFEQYQRLIEALEDEGLYQAMQKTLQEKSLSRDAALKLLDK